MWESRRKRKKKKAEGKGGGQEMPFSRRELQMEWKRESGKHVTPNRGIREEGKGKTGQRTVRIRWLTNPFRARNRRPVFNAGSSRSLRVPAGQFP